MKVLHEDAPQLTPSNPLHISIREAFGPGMNDFHVHSHYEISFITKGNADVLLDDKIHNVSAPCVLLLRPYTQHYIIPSPDQIYKRINVSFFEEFVFLASDDRIQYHRLFSAEGNILFLDERMCEEFEKIILMIEKDENLTRKRLLLLYILSLLEDVARVDVIEESQIPDCVSSAIRYINEHFSEKITIAKICKFVGVGRTTLTASFRKSTGMTVHQYVLNIRLKNASILRKQGASLEEAATQSGFGDTSVYVRARQRVYGGPSSEKDKRSLPSSGQGDGVKNNKQEK